MSEQKSCSDRFNAFHLEVSILNDRMGWLLEKLFKSQITDDSPGFELLEQIHSDLEALIDKQDCREHTIPTLKSLPPHSREH